LKVLKMPFAILLVGAVIVVVAFNNTHGQLADQLAGDAAGYTTWALAIAAILALGYVPGLKTPSRWILGLVGLVIVLKGGSQILDNFTQFATSAASDTAPGSVAAEPSAAYAANPAAGATPTSAEITGGSAGSTSSASAKGAAMPGWLDPGTYLKSFAPADGFQGVTTA
jgi:hypothetical protein